MSRRISQLPSYPDAVNGTEVVPIEHNTDNWKISTSSLRTYFNPSVNYKEYVCNLTQSSTSAPVPKVLSNTFGTTATWTRDSTGVYSVTFGSAVLTEDYTMVLFHNASGFGSGTGSRSCAYYNGTTIVTIETRNSSNAAADGFLNDTSLEIRVYNT